MQLDQDKYTKVDYNNNTFDQKINSAGAKNSKFNKTIYFLLKCDH